eukprot:14854.XXX_882082_879061_1 [CDS] Oithona nana genome sequencing.
MAASTLMGISLCGGSNIRRKNFLHVKMGQNYTKYCHVSSMLKYPVDSFNETSGRREELHGKADFTLIVKGTHFQVHKEVLMKSSRYFETMLTLFDERLKSEVELKDIIEPPTMALTLHFIYEGHVSGVRKRLLNKRNVHDLLQLAIYLQMQLLQNLCIKYIQDRLEKKNCIPLYQQTLDMGPFELQLILEDYILQHFEAIVAKNHKQLNDLNRVQLCKLLANDKLLVTSEATVYKAVLQWVQSNPAERSQYWEDLLDHVHFTLMSKDEVENCLQNSVVKKNLNLVNKLKAAIDYLEKPTDEKIDYWTTKPKPARWPKIYVVMRMYWKNLPMEYYDFRNKSWTSLCDVQNWRSCTSMVSHGTCIYFIGGEETDSDSPTGSRTVNRVTRYDCEKKQWISVPSMQLARRWAGSIVIDNKIYVIGGIGGKGGTFEKRLDSMEVLDLDSVDWKASRRDRNRGGPKWKMLTPMSTPRSSHTVEVLDGVIYVVGGGDGREWLCTAESYNPKTLRWSPIASLNVKRWKCGLVALGGCLYAIGGMDSPKAGHWGLPLKTVERYDPAHDKWTEITSMNEARFGCAVAAYQGKIYVTGGFGASKAILSSQECYDPDLDKWTKMPAMKKMCGFVGGVLVDRPVHFQDRPISSATGTTTGSTT